MKTTFKPTFIRTKFNSHKRHNPECDILQGHIDEDSFITYCIYVKGPRAGNESMEYYHGSNYNVGSDKRSYSRHFMPNQIPGKWRAAWEELKQLYQTEYAK